MSLHALAGHMSTKGRNGDSMLVHMTPGEVAGLQALAIKEGGSLTINPDTGLPEANFLKSILPMVAGFALGPAGFGLMSAGMAGAAVGGVTALATGSLSRGLMAGMGAYGGASLGAGLMGSGAGAAQEAAMSGLTQDQIAQQAAAQGLSEQGVLNQAAANATKDFLAKGASDRLMEGAAAAYNDPSAFVKGMGGLGKTASMGLAAISPMLADQGVQTTTKRPDTGTIRNYTFDPYGQTYTSAGNYPASEYKGMADGGIVALAAGGDYRSLTKDSSAADIASAYKQAVAASGGDTKANQDTAINYLTNLGIDQDRIGQAYTQFQAAPTYTDYTQQNVTDYLRSNPNIDIAAEAARLNANPLLVNQAISQLGAGYLDPTQTTGGSGAGQYYDALTSAGIDANELYAANRALNPDYSGFSLDEMQRAFNVAKQFDTYQYDSAPGDQLAKDIAALRQYDLGGFGGDKSQQILDIARETGLSLDEATRRYDAARAAMQPKAVIPGNLDTVGNLPGGVSGGGNTVVNPNGTITTAPNIPGRPEGGFTGMGQVRDAYTAGGGSLGYTNNAPKTMEEFNQRFNNQTGDSKAAYDYLVGKGAYPTKSGVEQLMRPYKEATLGMPVAEGRPTQKFIFENGKYVENPNYRPMSYNNKGERIVGLTSAEVLKGVQGLKDPTDDVALFDFVTDNVISEAQLAAALGISIAEARARIAAGKKAKGPDASAVTNAYMTDGGGDSTGNGFDGFGPSDTSITGMSDSLAAAGQTNGADVASMGSDDGFGSFGGADVGGVGASAYRQGGVMRMALGGLGALAGGGSTSQYNLGGYSDGGRLLRGPGDGVSDSIPATIGNKQPARLADGEFVVPARIVSELGNGSTEAGARKLYAMMDRVQKARGKTTGKSRVAANTRSDKYLPA